MEVVARRAPLVISYREVIGEQPKWVGLHVGGDMLQQGR